MNVNEFFKKRENVLYAGAFALAILFVLFRVDLFGVGAAVAFISAVLIESINSAKEKGWVNEVKEIVIAIAAALLLWFGASVVLGTESPFNAVVSCSMLDTLQRGDVVVLSGGGINAPEVELAPEKFDKMAARGEEHFMCGFCRDGVDIRPCSINPATGKEENGEVLQYDCGICTQTYMGVRSTVACAKGVLIGGKYISAVSKDGDIIVYRPKKSDVFAMTGDIIHRAIVKIRVGDKAYYLTKGDNNLMFDVQMHDATLRRTNSIVEDSQVLGKGIATLPVLGYVKLVASGQIANPKNCYARVYYEENKNSSAN